MLNFFKALYLWLTNKQKRITSFRFIRMSLSILEKAAKHTPTDIDDNGIEFLLKKFESATSFLEPEEKQKVIDDINMDAKLLKNIRISYDLDKRMTSLSLGSLGLTWDANDGSFAYTVNPFQ